MDEQDQYWRRPTMPSTALVETKPRTDTDRQAWIVKSARRVLSSYRTDDFADAEGFLTQLWQLLESYADEVIEAVTGKSGIQTVCKWPPSLAEVREMCEIEAQRIERRIQYAGLRRAPRIRFEGRAVDIDALIKKHGRPVGPFEHVNDRWNRR